MENQLLYDKYLHGRHWDSHLATSAGTFAVFLLERRFTGMVVDVGCGSGRDVEKMASFGLDAIGIDNSPQEIRSASARFPGRRFFVYDIESLPFVDDSIGAFHAVNVIHYVNQPRTIGEIWRTLCLGGWLFIHFNLLIKDLEQNRVDYRQDEGDIRRLVKHFHVEHEATFTREDKTPIDHMHTVLQLILRKQ